jgi:hypothetical protein
METALVMALSLAAAGEPHDAFAPGALWPDDQGHHINAHGGGILAHEGMYYWFGEHKIAGTAGNVSHVGVHVYASTDLYHWRDEGIALQVSEDPHSEITDGSVIERPKVIFCAKTGKFVMWFHLELKGQGYLAARSGVAVADAPTGPYRYLGSFRPNAGVWPRNVPDDLKRPLSAAEQERLAHANLPGGPVANFPQDELFRRDFAGGQMARDMTVYVADDGAAYHLYASEENSTLHISQLSDDFLGESGQYVRVFPGRFNEAPAIFQHGGKWWLFSSDCTGWAPNPGRLAVADSVWGPWTALANPWIGDERQRAISFDSQPTFVLPVTGRPGAFIFMADRWRPENAIDGRYLWLPIEFRDGVPVLEWRERWDLSVFPLKG